MPSYHIYDGKKVTLMCCSDCNVQCHHCYISYEGNFLGHELYKCAKKLKESGYQVALNGSELLLHEDYLPIFTLLRQSRVMTNGLVFRNNFSYFDKLKNYGIVKFNLSYHFDLHDMISPIPKEFLKQLISEIKSRGLDFTINCTISTINKDNIEDYCREAYTLGASRIRFTNLLNQGEAFALNRELFLNEQQIIKVLELVQKCRLQYDKDMFYIERCGSFGTGARVDKFCCPAGKNSVFITPDLKVYPCAFLAKRGNEIGYYDGGKIFIRDDFENDHTKCLAKSKLNGL